MTIHHLVLPDDAETTRALLGRSDPSTGMIVVQARPDARHFGWIAKDLLQVLGQTLAPRTTGRVAADDVTRSRAWLIGHQVAHLVVIDSQALRPRLVAELVDFVRDLPGLDLWLADHLPTSSRHEEHLRALRVAEVELADLPAPRTPGQEDVATPTPAVPRVPFPRFRAHARDVLAPADFAVIDRIYRSAFEQVLLAPQTNASIVATAHSLIQRAPDSHSRTTVARAAQAAAFTNGFDLDVDLQSLAAGLPTPNASSLAARRQVASYADPQRAVVCVLATLGSDAETQLTFRLGDVTGDGAAVGHLPIPRWARPVVRAHCSIRQAAPGNDSLLLESPSGGPWTARAVRRVIARSADDLGVGLDPTSSARKGRSADATQFGLAIRRAA